MQSERKARVPRLVQNVFAGSERRAADPPESAERRCFKCLNPTTTSVPGRKSRRRWPLFHRGIGLGVGAGLGVGVLAWLASPSLWSVVGALAGVASAVAAFLTIQSANEARLQELKARRPYFVLTAPRFQNAPDGGQILNLNLRNEGGRPASSVKYALVSVEEGALGPKASEEPDQLLDLRAEYEVSSELAPNQPFPWWLPVRLPSNSPPHVFRLTISFTDEILGDAYSQIYDMRWGGVQNGQTSPDLTFTSRAQSERLDVFLARARSPDP